MAEPDRQTSDSIAGEMASRPYAFNFFQAVRRLEAEYRTWPRVGWSIRLEEDFLRFCQVPSLSFAPSSLESIELREGVIRMFVNFLGMFGPNGPLPQHLTDFARDRLRNAHDPTLVRFIDIFHHRMLSFFYRAWAINEKSVDFDRSDHARLPPISEVCSVLESRHFEIETRYRIGQKFILPVAWPRKLGTLRDSKQSWQTTSVSRRRSRSSPDTG